MNKNWEEQWEALQGQHTRVLVDIQPSYSTSIVLDKEQLKRLLPKFQLIENWATEMAENMIKGTIKYSTDKYTQEEWMEYIQDEIIDLLNYKLLMEESV